MTLTSDLIELADVVFSGVYSFPTKQDMKKVDKELG